MTELTLVLPFALPPPELAPDLVRALRTPSLAALITRTSSHHSDPFDNAARALPHELWLARALGLGQSPHQQSALRLAAAVMRGHGLDPGEGHWLIVHPAHVEISRSHLLMHDLRRLGLADAESRALFDSAKPYFDESGHTLLYADAQTWFLRADAWRGLDTASPDAATGMNLTDWLPLGTAASAYRKLQNEVQMLWHGHPANAAREARGLAAINGFWPWAGAEAADRSSPGIALATRAAPSWLTRLATHPDTSLSALDAVNAPLLVDGSLAESALAADWAGWLTQMQRLEDELFAPLLAALATGRRKRLRLVLSRREAQLDITTSPMAQRAFWRRPSLDRLSP
ncbi:MAG: hypothetical protein ABIT83_20050 [Massilia sp.]